MQASAPRGRPGATEQRESLLRPGPQMHGERPSQWPRVGGGPGNHLADGYERPRPLGRQSPFQVVHGGRFPSPVQAGVPSGMLSGSPLDVVAPVPGAVPPPPRIMPQGVRRPAPEQPLLPPTQRFPPSAVRHGQALPPASEEECEDETTTLPPPMPTKCTTVIGKACFLDTSEEIVAGRQPATRSPFKQGVARTSGENAGRDAVPTRKIFAGRSFFRAKSPLPASNKTFGESAYFRQNDERLSNRGSTSRIACAVYGSMVTILLGAVLFGLYQWKDFRRRRHYRLLGSFRDSRHPAYDLDPDCNACDYKSALELPQQLTAIAS